MSKNYNDISDKAKDLILHANSSKHLHKHKEAILDNLARKMLRKEYDIDNAKAFWQGHADHVAKDVADIHGEPSDVWHKMFPEGTRKEAASHWEELHREHLKHRHEHHENIDENGNVIVESAFKRLENKIKRKEGYSEKGAAGAAYEAGVKKYGKAGMAAKAAAGKKHHSESENIELTLTENLKIPKNDIERIVNRYHVGTPDEDIANELKKRIGKSKSDWPEEAVKQAVFHAIKHHHKNKELYRRVMSGNLNEEDRSLYFSMLNAAMDNKPADLKTMFNEAIQPSIIDAIDRMKDDLRQFVFKFTNGEDVTNEPVQEDYVNEASKVLLANYAKKKPAPHPFSTRR